MGCLERDLSLFNLSTEATDWTLTAKKPGEWFRPVEEAAEEYMKHWLVTKRSKQQKDERLRYKLPSNLKRRCSEGPGGGGGDAKGGLLAFFFFWLVPTRGLGHPTRLLEL